jgi:hypothetical protein
MPGCDSEDAAMWMPFFSVTMIEALFGNHVLGAVAEPKSDADAEYAQRAGYRLGPNGEWIADHRRAGRTGAVPPPLAQRSAH